MSAPEAPLDGLERTTIAGDVAVDLEAAVARHPLVERECRTRCASGDRFEGCWRGVPLADLLVDVDPRSTHLVVEAADGFRACVDVADALDGIVALERIDGSGRDDAEGCPRLVVPGLLGTRMVKDVVRLETRRLDPDEDPEELERLDPDDSG